MLTGDFFNIIHIEAETGTANAILEINPTHRIFAGHFPGRPVVPGVCMIQMVKEILELALTRAVRLSRAEQIKFLTVIDPVANNIVHAGLKYNIGADEQIKLAASLVSGPVVYFKMNGVFLIL